MIEELEKELTITFVNGLKPLVISYSEYNEGDEVSLKTNKTISCLYLEKSMDRKIVNPETNQEELLFDLLCSINEQIMKIKYGDKELYCYGNKSEVYLHIFDNSNRYLNRPAKFRAANEGKPKGKEEDVIGLFMEIYHK